MSEKLSLVTCTSCGKPIPPGSESTKFSAQTAAKSKLNEMENAANSADFTNAPNAASADHKRRIAMGSHTCSTYKVFPEDIVPSFDHLKAKIKASLPEFAQLKVGAKKKLPSDSKRYLFKSDSQKTNPV